MQWETLIKGFYCFTLATACTLLYLLGKDVYKKRKNKQTIKNGKDKSQAA
jgi:hypothetical protein